jgi:hypothetical protein
MEWNRLARKAELARASRRRKKEYVGQLEARIAQLNQQIAELENRQNGSQSSSSTASSGGGGHAADSIMKTEDGKDGSVSSPTPSGTSPLLTGRTVPLLPPHLTLSSSGGGSGSNGIMSAAVDGKRSSTPSSPTSPLSPSSPRSPSFGGEHSKGHRSSGGATGAANRLRGLSLSSPDLAGQCTPTTTTLSTIS